ncbi:MAG TPA: hypothetical protein VN948_09120 [Terriglobales bacterium]|nr:hypothetical protein [Terriglobales bacterium]
MFVEPYIGMDSKDEAFCVAGNGIRAAFVALTTHKVDPIYDPLPVIHASRTYCAASG